MGKKRSKPETVDKYSKMEEIQDRIGVANTEIMEHELLNKINILHANRMQIKIQEREIERAKLELELRKLKKADFDEGYNKMMKKIQQTV